MKHIYLFIKSLFVFLLLMVWAGTTWAQISVSVQVLPPYLYRVTDYASHPERILITLVNTSTSAQRLQLRGSITGDNGIEMRVRNTFKSRTPFIMAASEVRVLNAGDFSLFFDLDNIVYTGISQFDALRGNGLPEGNYRMCVQAFNYDTNAALSAESPSGCSNSFGVNNIEPPVILVPRDRDEIVTNGTQLLTLSWGTPPGAPPTTMYRVRIVEILGNGNPNDAMMTAGQPFFETEVRGNMYIYSPADPQLTLGRRYAMRVTAFDPLSLTNFRNKGQSAVTSFTYGTALAAATGATGSNPLLSTPIVTPAPVATVMAYMTKLTGTVAFAYLEEEEKEEAGSQSLTGSTPIAEGIAYERLENTKAGAKRTALANAKVMLYGTNIDGVPTVLAYSYSSASGTYNLSAVNSEIAKSRDVYLEVVHDNQQLFPVKQYLKLTQQPNSSFDADLGTTVMPLVSMRIKPFVVSRTGFAADKVTIKILVPQRKFDMTPLFKQAGLAPTNEQVLIGRSAYYVLAKLNNGNTFKKLFRLGNGDSYMVEISAPDKPAMYYPLESLSNRTPSDTTKIIGAITKNFVYNPIVNDLEGKVTFNAAPFDGSRIQATVKVTDIVDGSTATIFEAVSDNAGYYKFTDLPALKRNATISLSAIERRIQDDPFTATVVTNGSALYSKNFDFILKEKKKGVVTIQGRLQESTETNRLVNLSGGIVRLEGSNISTQVMNDGWFIIKVPFPFTGKLLASVEGYKDTYVQTYWNMTVGASNGIFTPQSWADNVSRPQEFRPLQSSRMASAMGIGSGSLEDAAKTYINSDEEIKQIYASTVTGMKKQPQGDVNLTFFLTAKVGRSTELVAGRVWVDGVEVKPAEAGQNWIYNGTPGTHTFRIEPIKGGATYFAQTGEFTILNQVYGVVKGYVYLQPAIMVSGVVKDDITGKVVEGATVSVNGLNYQVTTDSKGEYQLLLPNNKEYKIEVVKPSYEGTSTVTIVNNSQTLDFPVKYLDPALPVYQTLAGFPVKISKISKISEGNFSITGTLTLGSNDLYTIDAANSKLTFSNVSVKSTIKETNAIPTADVTFEQAVVTVKAFGFAPVELQGQPLLQMKALQAGNYSNVVIGGNQLVLKLSSTKSNEKLAIQLPDAAIKDKATNNTFNYVFSAPGAQLNELNTSRTFVLQFAPNGNFSNVVAFNTNSSSTYEEIKGAAGSFFVDKAKATLSNLGYNIGGYYQLPEISGFTVASDKKKIQVANFNMKPNVTAEIIDLGISDTNPFTANMQKFQVLLNKMELSGLGSANPSLVMGGKLSLLKNENGAVDGNGILTIKTLSLISKAEGTTLSAIVKLPKTGLTVKSLNFTTLSTTDEISMSYNFAESSFALETSGTLRYVSSSSAGGFSSALSSVFPIIVDKFRLRSKDWDMYLVARPNAEIDLKVAKVKVSRILVNVGYGMSMDAMANDLVSTTPKTLTSTEAVNSMEQMDETRSTWAIGIAGGINFPINGIKAGAAVSLVVGNTGKGIDVVLREFDLSIVNPSFTLTTKVAMQFNSDKQGFEAAAKLTTMSKEFLGTFKYYSLSGGGLQLGASIKTNAGVATGPIMWHSLGGGFDFDTRTERYSVFFTGDVSPLGVPKNIASVRDAKIEVLFDMAACGGSPVITGSGALFMKDASWGTMNMTADFCKGLFLVSVKTQGQIAVVDGVSATVRGVLYGVAPQNGSGGAFFLGFNANAYVGSLIRGNATVALAYNYNNNAPGVTSDLKAMFGLVNPNAVDADGIMNAIYLKGTLNVPTVTAGLEAKVFGFDAFAFRYKFQNYGDVELYYKYKESKFMARTAISSVTEFRVTLLGATIGALQSTDLTLEGGYDGTWYTKGNAKFAMQFFTDDRAACNSFNITFCSPPAICPCFSYWYGFPYPNGNFNCSCGSNWVPCGAGFKLCLSAAADYSVSSSGTDIKFKLL